jgi:hypothetical protein
MPDAIIRAHLAGDICTAAGLTAKSPSPVLALCRKLMDAGYDPSASLEVHRGDTLAFRVKSIWRGAQLRMGASPAGTPILKRHETCPAARPVRQKLEAVE